MVVDYFNLHYSDDKLACWQAVSRDIVVEVGDRPNQCKKVHGLPAHLKRRLRPELTRCIEILKDVFYNIIDFVHARRQGKLPHRFGSAAQLRNYIIATNKFFPLHKAKANPVLEWMLINV